MKPMTYTAWRDAMRLDGFSKGCALLGLDPVDMDDMGAPLGARIVGFAIFPGNGWIAMLGDGLYMLDAWGEQHTSMTLDRVSMRLFLYQFAMETADHEAWTLTLLSDLYDHFLGFHQLPEISADELAAIISMKDPYQRTSEEQGRINWLLWFGKVWEEAQDREIAA